MKDEPTQSELWTLCEEEGNIKEEMNRWVERERIKEEGIGRKVELRIVHDA